MIFAVDFDGTIVEQAWPDIGKERPDATSVLKILQENGHKIIILTGRNGGKLVEMWEWLQGKRFTPDAVNGNLYFIEGMNVPKIHADVYFEDKCFPPFTNWSHVFNVYIMNNPITEIISENEKFCKAYFYGDDAVDCGRIYGSEKCELCEKRTMTLHDYMVENCFDGEKYTFHFGKNNKIEAWEYDYKEAVLKAAEKYNNTHKDRLKNGGTIILNYKDEYGDQRQFECGYDNSVRHDSEYDTDEVEGYYFYEKELQTQT